jgi:hypothetical protein
MEENCTPEEKRNFKIKMAEWLYDLSICFSNDAEPISKEKIIVMVEMIVRIIESNKMSFELQPYSNAIKMIACGKSEIYRFNIVNLMKVFNEQYEIFEKAKQYRPEKW